MCRLHDQQIHMKRSFYYFPAGGAKSRFLVVLFVVRSGHASAASHTSEVRAAKMHRVGVGCRFFAVSCLVRAALVPCQGAPYVPVTVCPLLRESVRAQCWILGMRLMWSTTRHQGQRQVLSGRLRGDGPATWLCFPVRNCQLPADRSCPGLGAQPQLQNFSVPPTDGVSGTTRVLLSMG